MSVDRKIHFERMRETSLAVIPIIKNKYSEFVAQNRRLSVAMDRFVAKRTGDAQLLMRPYLVRLGFEVVGGSDWHTILPLCAAAEIFNISTYQANLAFDSKMQVSTKEERSLQYACAMVSLGIAAEIIQSSKFALEHRNNLLQGLLNANKEGYIGQFLDLNQLNLNVLEDSPNYSALWDLYVDRCGKLGGALTSWCLQSGALLSGCCSNQIEHLRLIGGLVGTAGQMVNDIGDFVPLGNSSVAGVRYQEAYGDIRQGKLTGPILWALEHGSSDVTSIIMTLGQKKKVGREELLHLTDLLKDVGAFEYMRRQINGFHQRALLCVDKIPKSRVRSLLKLAFTSLTCNKYFAALRTHSYLGNDVSMAVVHDSQ